MLVVWLLIGDRGGRVQASWGLARTGGALVDVDPLLVVAVPLHAVGFLPAGAGGQGQHPISARYSVFTSDCAAAGTTGTECSCLPSTTAVQRFGWWFLDCTSPADPHGVGVLHSFVPQVFTKWPPYKMAVQHCSLHLLGVEVHRTVRLVQCFTSHRQTLWILGLQTNIVLQNGCTGL